MEDIYIVYDIRCETTTTTLLALLQNPIQQSEGGKIDTLSPPTTLDHHCLVCFNRNSIKKSCGVKLVLLNGNSPFGLACTGS